MKCPNYIFNVQKLFLYVNYSTDDALYLQTKVSNIINN